MPDTYVDTEVEVEVDSTELDVEAGAEDEFEAELSAPGVKIEVEAEIEVAGEPSEADERGATEDDEYLEPEAEGMAPADSEAEDREDPEPSDSPD